MPNRPEVNPTPVERAVTLRDVADRSGVAVSTVSRVLNNQTEGFSVRSETRERVLDAAKALNYRPDPILRSMRAKRTNLIAILGISDFGTSVLGSTEQALNAMMNSLLEKGYQLCTLPRSLKEDLYQPPRWRVDGAVVIDCLEAGRLAPLDASGIPYVSLNGVAGRNGVSVAVDDESGTREALHHLMVLGHRRIAFVMPDEHIKPHPSIQARFSAYRSALQQWGIKPLSAELPTPARAIDVISEQVVRGGATALLVYHHVMTVKLLRAARVAGLSVPHDVSMVCFNDTFPAADLVPSLTAMALPSEEMGRTAARLLAERLEGRRHTVDEVLLTEKLVIRESTAPPRGGA